MSLQKSLGALPRAADALRFLKSLDPDAATFNLRSFADSGSVGARNHVDVSGARIPALIDQCIEDSRGLFVVANAGGQRATDIKRVRAVFIDIDAKNFPDSAACADAMRFASEGRRKEGDPIPVGWPPPSAVVRSGGGGFHVWWFVEALPNDRFPIVQKALAAHFNGDPSVCDLSRVMRVPGSIHFKYEPALVELVECDPTRRYDVDDLMQRLGIVLPTSLSGLDIFAPRCADNPEVDSVLRYLRSHPECLKQGGRLGPQTPVDVVCPNAKEHSEPDGLTSTVYMPHGFNAKQRGFLCSHGHCATLTLHDFLLHIGYEQECKSLEADDCLAKRFITWLDGGAMYARGQWYVNAGSHWKLNKNGVERLLKDFAEELHHRIGKEFVVAIRTGDESLKKIAADNLRAATRLLNQSKQEAVLKATSVRLHRDAVLLDTEHDLLCVPNGIVDLKVGVLLPSDHAYGFTMVAGVEYNPDAKCTRFEQFIYEVFPDPEVAAYIQRWCGYLLTGRMNEEVMGAWYGAGANGKSVLMNVLAHVMGDFAIVGDPSMLMARSPGAGAASPDIARLVGRRLVYLNESRAGDRLNDARVKQLVSTEKMTARALYRDPFDFYPTAKLVLRTNNKPLVDDNSEGMWRRLHLVPFEQSFNGPSRDYTLADRLKSELPGILAWCVRGAAEWFAKGLAAPASVVTATEAYRLDSDDFSEWTGVCLEHGGFTPTRTLLDLYARHAGLKFPPTAKRFNAMMREKGFRPNRTSTEKGFNVSLRSVQSDCEFV